MLATYLRRSSPAPSCFESRREPLLFGKRNLFFLKQYIVPLVVGWVTTGESENVDCFFLFANFFEVGGEKHLSYFRNPCRPTDAKADSGKRLVV